MKYDSWGELKRAAPKRLSDAWELLEHPTRNRHEADAPYRHLCAARYLGGYAVECILKVHIILLVRARSHQPIEHWGEVIDYFQRLAEPLDLSGAHSHDLGKLFSASQLAGHVDGDRETKQAWGRCVKWDYAERYRPGHVLSRERIEVEDFVKACDSIYHWVTNQLRD